MESSSGRLYPSPQLLMSLTAAKWRNLSQHGGHSLDRGNGILPKWSCQSYSLKWGSVEKFQTMNMLPVVDNLLKDLGLELNSERVNTLKSKIYEPSQTSLQYSHS